MKATLNCAELSAALELLAGIVPKRSPKPILCGVSISAAAGVVTIAATDLERWATVRLHKVEIDAEGIAVVSFATLRDFAKANKVGTVAIDASDAGGSVASERSKITLATWKAKDYPAAPAIPADAGFTIAADDLGLAIRQSHAMDSESSRYALGGLKIESENGALILVTTDGRRLTKVSIPADAPEGIAKLDDLFIVTASAVAVVAKLAKQSKSIELRQMKNAAVFITESVTLYSKLLEGRFPRWRDVFASDLPSYVQISIATGPMLEALKMVKSGYCDECRGVTLEANAGRLTLSTGLKCSECSTTIDVAFQGHALTCLDWSFVRDCIEPLGKRDSITLRVKTNKTAAFWECRNYATIVMPLANDNNTEVVASPFSDAVCA